VWDSGEEEVEYRHGYGAYGVLTDEHVAGLPENLAWLTMHSYFGFITHNVVNVLPRRIGRMALKMTWIDREALQHKLQEYYNSPIWEGMSIEVKKNDQTCVYVGY